MGVGGRAYSLSLTCAIRYFANKSEGNGISQRHSMLFQPKHWRCWGHGWGESRGLESSVLDGWNRLKPETVTSVEHNILRATY